MRRWKEAGPAPKGVDDQLWKRFRAAQDVFFGARDAASAATDAEYAENATKKEALLVEAEALLPVTDLAAAKAAFRDIADRWDAAGKVPRERIKELEGRMRKVEQAIRGVEDDAWRRSNPEARARAADTVAQLEASIADLEKKQETPPPPPATTRRPPSTPPPSRPASPGSPRPARPSTSSPPDPRRVGEKPDRAEHAESATTPERRVGALGEQGRVLARSAAMASASPRRQDALHLSVLPEDVALHEDVDVPAVLLLERPSAGSGRAPAARGARVVTPHRRTPRRT